MKAKILRENLLRCLATISRAIPSSSPLPILTNILFEVKESCLFVSANNLEFSISTKTGLKSDDTFTAIVPYKIFQEFVATMNSAIVSIEYDLLLCNMTVSCDGTKANIKCLPVEEYPPVKSITGKTIELNTSDLKLAIAHTSFAAAEASHNPILNCVYITTEETGIAFVATDSFRFSVHRIAMDFDKPFHAIIPGNSLNEAIKIMTNDKVSIAIENNSVMIKSGENEIICQQADGPYIDYKILEQTITTTFEPSVSFEVLKSDLQRACKQASIFTGDKQIITIDVQPLFVQVNASEDEIGDGSSSIVGKILGSPEIVKLNYKFVSQILNCIQTEKVRVDIKVKVDILGKTKPVVFYCEGKNDFYHVIMPFG
jgi:DNA polymerase III subunit beta